MGVNTLTYHPIALQPSELAQYGVRRLIELGSPENLNSRRSNVVETALKQRFGIVPVVSQDETRATVPADVSEIVAMANSKMAKMIVAAATESPDRASQWITPHTMASLVHLGTTQPLSNRETEALVNTLCNSAKGNRDAQSLAGTPACRDMLLVFGKSRSLQVEAAVLDAIHALVVDHPAAQVVFATADVRDMLIRFGNTTLGGSLAGVKVNAHALKIDTVIDAILANNPEGQTVFDTPEMRNMRTRVQHDRQLAMAHPGF